MPGKIELLEAELAMERAALEFRTAKEKNDGKPAAEKRYRETKAILSEARRKFREIRGEVRAQNEGDAVVAPKAIAGKVR